MTKPVPTNLTLKGVIERLQAYKDGFYLYEDKPKKSRAWIIIYKGESGEIEAGYPIIISSGLGKKGLVNQRRLAEIAKHFKVPLTLFTLTPKEITQRRQKATR